MRYITGIHALNLACSLNTCGDWHASALQWTVPNEKESADSLFGDYGIEKGRSIPEHEGTYHVANHIRAILDLLQDGRFSVAQGMNKDFICTSEYDKEIFDKVYMMRFLPNWQEINAFMEKEYKMKWLKYLGGREKYELRGLA